MHFAIQPSKSLISSRLNLTSLRFVCGTKSKFLKLRSRKHAIQCRALMDDQYFSSMYFRSLARNGAMDRLSWGYTASHSLATYGWRYI